MYKYNLRILTSSNTQWGYYDTVIIADSYRLDNGMILFLINGKSSLEPLAMYPISRTAVTGIVKHTVDV